MKAIELIRWTLQATLEGTNAIVGDMRNAALTQPTDSGGNHTIWLLGHLAFVEGAIMQILSGAANPVQKWEALFATGTRPTADAGKYPSFDEVHRAYRDGRARTLKYLDEVGEAGLDRAPQNVPPGFEDAMASVGRTFVTLNLHNMVHYGQVADARRVAGLKPLM